MTQSTTPRVSGVQKVQAQNTGGSQGVPMGATETSSFSPPAVSGFNSPAIANLDPRDVAVHHPDLQRDSNRRFY